MHTAYVDGDKDIAAKAVRSFPLLFKTFPNVDMTRAMRLWEMGDRFLALVQDDLTLRLSISRNTPAGLKRVNLKVVSGRGRKRSPFVDTLHHDLKSEFDPLQKHSVKFNHSLLRIPALKVLRESENGVYGMLIVNVWSGKMESYMITFGKVQSVCDRYRIAQRLQYVELEMSSKDILRLGKDIARRYGQLKCAFERGESKEENVNNADETHFILNMDNGKTLGVCGDDDVR